MIITETEVTEIRIFCQLFSVYSGRQDIRILNIYSHILRKESSLPFTKNSAVIFFLPTRFSQYEPVIKTKDFH